MDKRHKKRAACERLRRSGLIGFLFHDKNPLGSGLASGGPFPRSRKLSGAQLAFTGPNWAQWLLRQNRADQERAKIRRASPVGSFSVGSRKGRLGPVKHHSTPEHLWRTVTAWLPA